jgi:cardiolipin synthase C
LMFGTAVNEIRSSFEEYWNDKRTITCSELVGKSKKKFTVPALFEKLHRFAEDTTYFSQQMRKKVKAFPETFKDGAQKGEFLWLRNVTFVADKPGKNEDRPDEKGGICADSIVSLVKNAKSSIDVQTPYFITSDESLDLLSKTIAKGVKIRVLTNSLASIDNEEAFGAYQRERKKNLAIGLELYEFKPDAKVRFKIMSPEVQEKINYEAVFGFHAKSIIIDNSIVVVGSYNLDPASTNLNTENFAIIRSPEMARMLAKHFNEDFKEENSWHITPEFNPDKQAPVKKQIKNVAKKVIPKDVL